MIYDVQYYWILILYHFQNLLLYKMTLLRSAEFPSLAAASCLVFAFLLSFSLTVYLKENLNDFSAGLTVPNTRQYRTILDNIEWYWTISNNIGQYLKISSYRQYKFANFLAGLDGAQRLLVAANSQAALQTMMNQQNAAAMRGAAPLGGAPLILSPRLQVPTSLASGLLNGSTQAGPPPLIGKILSALDLARRSCKRVGQMNALV